MSLSTKLQRFKAVERNTKQCSKSDRSVQLYEKAAQEGSSKGTFNKSSRDGSIIHETSMMTSIFRLLVFNIY